LCPRPSRVGCRIFVASEASLLKARTDDFAARKEGAEAVLANRRRVSLTSWSGCCKQDVAPLIEVTRASKAHSDAENRLSDTITQTELERAKEYSLTRSTEAERRWSRS
jgi:adhesin transport system membrane fusion protein